MKVAGGLRPPRLARRARRPRGHPVNLPAGTFRTERTKEPCAVAEESADATTPAPAATAPDAPRRLPRWAPYAAVVAMLVVTASFALRPRPPASFGPFTARPITYEPGNERDPDISPDGKYVAYAQQAPNLNTRLVVRTINGGEPHDITAGTKDEWSPVWSPDGARIAFLRGR